MDHTEKPITFANLRAHYGTFRSFVIRGEGRDRVYGSRVGVMTNLGDLEQKEWMQLARKLIRESGETQLQAELLEWIPEHMLWLHTKAEQEQYALELHMSRIFDDPEWADYIPFNRKYRPEVLDSARLVWILPECCQTPAQVTQEQLKRAGEGSEATICCPICGRWARFRNRSLETDKSNQKGDSTYVCK